MKEVTLMEPERRRIWLPVQYGDAVTRVAYPPVQGTHQECFQALHADKELKPASGIELALITFGAYNGKEAEWKEIRQNCFVSNYTRVPYRMLLIPAGHIKGDKDLAGVLIEKDLQGKGLSTQMQVPELSKYTQKDGVYQIDNTSIFVPSDAYNGKSFEKDPLAHAHVTQEGATLFAKTARDAGKTPFNWIAERMKAITAIEQRVSMLFGNSDRLSVDGSSWIGRDDGFAFGVFLGAEEQSRKKAIIVREFDN